MKPQYTIPSLVEYDYTDPVVQQAIGNAMTLFPFVDEESERRAYVHGFMQGDVFKEIQKINKFTKNHE